ncbi:MAG: hypothetical protein AAF502_21940 [Bacteroidota bacterium]
MRDKKLYKLLRKLTQTELKSLRLFINSPYHNSNKNLPRFYAHIIKYAPEFNHTGLAEEKMLKALFGENYGDPKIISRLQSDLFKRIEEFIVTEKIHNQKINAQLLVLEFYRERRLNKLFEQKLKKTQHTQLNASYKNDEYYAQQFLIESEIHRYASMNDNRETEINLKNEVKTFQVYAVCKQIQHYCQLKTRQQLTDVDFNIDQLNYALERSGSSEFSNVPFVLCYNAAAHLLREKTINNYNSFKELLWQHKQYFPSLNLRNLITILENSAIEIFPTREKMYVELFSLYQLQARLGLFLVDDVLLPQIVKNVITVALRLGKISWAKEFLINHKQNIESFEVYQWNEARIFFANRDFPQTLNLLEGAKIEDTFYVLESRRLLLKTYYELGYFDLFFSYLNAFRVFLSRKKLKPEWKQMNLDFLKFAFHIASLAKYDSDKAEKLTHQISSKLHISDKEWLLEKLGNR